MAVVKGLRRSMPDLDIVCAHEVGHSETPDLELLSYCASEGRILLTQDIATMPAFAYQRAADGDPMPGVFVLHGRLSVGEAVEQVETLLRCCPPEELVGRVVHLPL